MQLQLETQSICDASCEWCPYVAAGPERVRGAMTPALFHKIIDEAAAIDHIDDVCLTGLGEPMLDRLLVERVRYVRQRKPAASISVYTNGGHLTPARFDALREAGLSALHISLNAVTGEQRKRIMGLDDWDGVVANVEHAIANRGSMDVKVKAVANRDSFTPGDVAAFYARWGWAERGGHGQAVLEGNWAGGNRTIHQTFRPNECCARAVAQIYVTWDGLVTACCFDPIGRHKTFGDLKTQSIKAVYNSPDYVAFREAHAADRADNYAFCASCTRI